MNTDAAVRVQREHEPASLRRFTGASRRRLALKQ
jgi:hypothetical protein